MCERPREPGQVRKEAAAAVSLCDALARFFRGFILSYLVLARKCRPEDFTSIRGQAHITRALQNAIERDRISHAFLFCGPRGVGKTSVARVLGKALNCQQGPTKTPCLKCTNCLEIAAGTSLAVREIDGASHNSVEDVRELIDSLRSLPPPGSRYKVYLIDEVHMFSIAAFNALLKSLEEPPPNTIFILATTESHKIPSTVSSRCQRYEFKSLPVETIQDSLREILENEKVEADDEVISLIARLSDGSMRDAQSLLDRVLSYCSDRLSIDEASDALGVVGQEKLFELSEAILKRDPDAALSIIHKVFSAGVDIRLFLNELVRHWRNLLMIRTLSSKDSYLLDVSEAYKPTLERQSQMISRIEMQSLFELTSSGCDSAIKSAYPHYLLEALVVRLATRERLEDISSLLENIKTSDGIKALSAEASNTKTPKIASKRVAIKKSTSITNSSSSSRSTKTNPDTTWRSFVQSVSQSNSKMLAESLKLLSVSSFENSCLNASGPKFAIKYLLENKAKLVELLNAFSGAKGWQIDLSDDEGEKKSVQSVLEVEKAEKLTEKISIEQSAQEDPKVQAIRQIFPGSTLDV